VAAPLLTAELPQLCLKCGKPGTFTAYRSLNAALHPRLAADLLSGKLLGYRCWSCGSRRRVPYPLLYHAPREKLLLLWFPSREELAPGPVARVVRAAGLPGPMPEGYRYRICVDFNDFTEKERIFAAGLDDRAIEWFKAFIAEEAFGAPGTPPAIREAMRSREAQPRFIELAEHGGKQGLRFVYPALWQISRPGAAAVEDMVSFYFPREQYRRAAAQAEKRMQMPPPVFWRFTRVDYDLARQASARGGREKLMLG
jgi:hypothetical protein